MKASNESKKVIFRRTSMGRPEKGKRFFEISDSPEGFTKSIYVDDIEDFIFKYLNQGFKIMIIDEEEAFSYE